MSIQELDHNNQIERMRQPLHLVVEGIIIPNNQFSFNLSLNFISANILKENNYFIIMIERLSGLNLKLYSRVPNNSTKEIRVPPCQISKT